MSSASCLAASLVRLPHVSAAFLISVMEFENSEELSSEVSVLAAFSMRFDGEMDPSLLWRSSNHFFFSAYVSLSPTMFMR